MRLLFTIFFLLINVDPTLAQLFGGGAASTVPLTLPITSPAAVYSVVKLSSWSGNCLQVQRTSDSTTIDIGFTNNLCAKAAADTFCAGTVCAVSKWYDQSGNGLDLVQAVVINQPTFSNLNEWLGIRPVSFDGTNGSIVQFMRSAVVATSQAVTVYQAAAPRASYEPNTAWELSDAGFTTSYAQSFTNSSALTVNYNGFSYPTATYPRASLGTLSIALNASGVLTRVNGVEGSRVAQGASQSIAGLTIGKNIAGTTAQEDLFALVVYASSHSSAQMQTIETALNTSLHPVSSWTNRLVYGGSSLIVGWQGTLNQQPPWQATFGRSTLWETYVMAVGGQGLTSEYANRDKYIALYDATKAKNVAGIDAPSNDISGQTFADAAAANTYATTLYNTVTLPFVVALKAAGFRVFVPTVIARGSFTTANFKENARTTYNGLVVSGAAANDYAASDRASNAFFSSQAATSNLNCYAADATHLTNMCYQVLSTYDQAAINQ